MGLKDYELLQFIGKGSYGSVHKAKRISDGFICVVKKITLEGSSEEEQREALNEVLVLCRIQHFNVVKLIDSFMEDTDLIIVMEYASGGDLWKKLQAQKEFFDEEELWAYLIQIAQGLKSLHDARIIHRDIKPQNIFLDEDDNIKIGDLGLGRMLGPMTQATQRIVGTPLYFSPELCEGRPYNYKTDIWALGCLMFELASLRPPFMASNQVALARKIVFESCPTLPKKYSMDLQFLIYRMLEKDTSKRPSVDQILASSAIRLRIERARIRQMEAKLQSQFQMMEQFAQQKKKMESEIAEEKKAISEQLRTIAMEKQKLAEERIMSVESMKGTFASELEKLYDDFQQEKEEKEKLRAMLRNVDEENKELKGKTMAWESKESEYIAKINELEHKCKEYEEFITLQNEELACMDNKLVPFRKKVAISENIARELESKCNALEQRISELDEERAQATLQKDDTRQSTGCQTDDVYIHTFHDETRTEFLNQSDLHKDSSQLHMSIERIEFVPERYSSFHSETTSPKLAAIDYSSPKVGLDKVLRFAGSAESRRSAWTNDHCEDEQSRSEQSQICPDSSERPTKILFDPERQKELVTPPRFSSPNKGREQSATSSSPRHSPRLNPAAPQNTKTGGLPKFSSEHFGLVHPEEKTPIQFAAYFGWKRIMAHTNPSFAGINTGRIQTGKVWDNRGKVTLMSAVRGFVCIYKVNNSLPSTPEIHSFRVRYQYEGDFVKMKTVNHANPKEKSDPLHGSNSPSHYFFVIPPHENKTINDIIIEFDIGNPIDEVCILRPDKRFLECIKDIPPLIHEDGTIVICPIVNDPLASLVSKFNAIQMTPRPMRTPQSVRRSPKFLAVKTNGTFGGSAQRVLAPLPMDNASGDDNASEWRVHRSAISSNVGNMIAGDEHDSHERPCKAKSSSALAPGKQDLSDENTYPTRVL